MNKKLKIILFVFIGVIIVGIIAGWLIWNKPHRSVKDEDAVKTTSVELYNSFLNDSSTAKTKYTNNIVEVSGDVIQVSKNQQGEQIVLLKTSTPNASVNCTMEGNGDNIKQGMHISLKGICNGYNSGDTDMQIPGDVVLIRCYTSN